MRKWHEVVDFPALDLSHELQRVIFRLGCPLHSVALRKSRFSPKSDQGFPELDCISQVEIWGEGDEYLQAW
jgi:hypothetical protein